MPRQLRPVANVATLRKINKTGSRISGIWPPVSQQLPQVKMAMCTVLAWELSNTMDAEFCAAALEGALARFG
tara:strand:+ start:1615 stop:1830 length:216 start_codon:yes stop_codon:yes gene_type:complete